MRILLIFAEIVMYMREKIKWILLGALLAVVTWPFWFPFVVLVLGLMKL